MPLFQRVFVKKDKSTNTLQTPSVTSSVGRTPSNSSQQSSDYVLPDLNTPPDANGEHPRSHSPSPSKQLGAYASSTTKSLGSSSRSRLAMPGFKRKQTAPDKGMSSVIFVRRRARPCSTIRLVALPLPSLSQAHPPGIWSHLHSCRRFGFATILQPGDHRSTRLFRSQKHLRCALLIPSKSSTGAQSPQRSQKHRSLTFTFPRPPPIHWIHLISNHSDLSDPLLLPMRSISIFPHHCSTNPCTNPPIIPLPP